MWVVTWTRSADQQPLNDGDGKQPLLPYGYGLSCGGPASPSGPGRGPATP